MWPQITRGMVGYLARESISIFSVSWMLWSCSAMGTESNANLSHGLRASSRGDNALPMLNELQLNLGG